MPLINSLHSPLFVKNQDLEEDKENSEINILVSKITFDILMDSPGLVADVANKTKPRDILETAIVKVMDGQKYHHGLSRDDVIKKVFGYMFGYGPLQEYVEDEDISDIDGTKYNEFTVKKNGAREAIPVNFGNEEIFDTFCKLIAIRNNGILNENDTHCRVTDEKMRLRINVSIRPRNISGPAINIRKHRSKSYTIDDLVRLEMMSPEMGVSFKNVAKTDANIIVCGKGASGKTTLLRAIVNEMPIFERVLICESDPEIYPDKKYCIEQRIKKSNEGGRPVTLRNLVQDGLTMTLDTYIIGEIVSDEAWEAVRAAHTGHRVLATTHAHNALAAPTRLVTLSKSANIGESEKTVKEMIGSSIDLIIFMKDFKVYDVQLLDKYDSEKDIFIFKQLYKNERETKDSKSDKLSELFGEAIG